VSRVYGSVRGFWRGLFVNQCKHPWIKIKPSQNIPFMRCTTS
jgi:hypothetical protein